MAEYEDTEIATEVCDIDTIDGSTVNSNSSKEHSTLNGAVVVEDSMGSKDAVQTEVLEGVVPDDEQIGGDLAEGHQDHNETNGLLSESLNDHVEADLSSDIPSHSSQNSGNSNVLASSNSAEASSNSKSAEAFSNSAEVSSNSADVAIEASASNSRDEVETAEQTSSAESNDQQGDSSSAFPESESAILEERTESDEDNIGRTESDEDNTEGIVESAAPVMLPAHTEPQPSDGAVATLNSAATYKNSDITPKESCASRNNHDTDLCLEDEASSQSLTTVIQYQEDDPSVNTLNMHSVHSSQEEQATFTNSPSNINTNSTINPSTNTNNTNSQIGVEVNVLPRTLNAEESDDDTLLSELDDLLHRSSSPAGEMSVPNSLLGEQVLPNGLRIDTLESSDSKKVLVEVEVLRRRCRDQEQELKRIQYDCAEKEGHIRKLMQTSQHPAAEINKESLRAHVLRIQELEVVADQYHQELGAAKERQISHDKAAKKAICQIQQEMILRVDQVKKLYEGSVKEKENMVIKYAKSEKEVLEQRKAREATEYRLREVTKNTETLNGQIKQLRKELSKFRHASEEKETVFASSQKEIEQLKEEISSQAIKVKWAQNKLKTELDAHKETKVQLSKTEQKLKMAKEETEQIRINCQEMIKTYQESEEIKSNSLDQKLKEKHLEMKQHLQEQSDHMELHETRLRELESLKKRYHDNMAELDHLQVKTKCLEDERLQNEELQSKFKELLNSQKEENRRLSKQVEELKAVQHKLEDAKQVVKTMETDISGQKFEFSELQGELDASKQKETELLQFTAKITASNTQLNSQNSSLNDKVNALTGDLKKLQEQLGELKKQHAQVSTELKQEKQYRERESTMLTSKLTEKAKAVEQLSIQLEDARDEMKTIKRKNLANVKDLSRQLQQAQKRLDAADSKDGGSSRDNISLGSRTSSNGSLDTLPNHTNSSSNSSQAGVGGSNNVGMAGNHSGTSHMNSAVNNTRFEDHHPPVQDHTVAIASNDYPGIDKNMLVERIVRLQRAQQRKNEKIEFMQEHVNSLVDEIKKKSKIIQQYVMREEAGALVTPASDANKAQMSKQSGIMSSLYRSTATDKTMTLDLSLEINRKLQSVLEDTLLKNITLKENLDTLGGEIAHLTRKLGAAQQNEPRPVRKK